MSFDPHPSPEPAAESEGPRCPYSFDDEALWYDVLAAAGLMADVHGDSDRPDWEAMLFLTHFVDQGLRHLHGRYELVERRMQTADQPPP